MLMAEKNKNYKTIGGGVQTGRQQPGSARPGQAPAHSPLPHTHTAGVCASASGRPTVAHQPKLVVSAAAHNSPSPIKAAPVALVQLVIYLAGWLAG